MLSFYPVARLETHARTKQVIVTGDSRRRKFDHVFGSDSTQEQVYRRTTLPLVNRCLEGYNATVLAYGQTGSGKTFTVGNAYTVRACAHRTTAAYFCVVFAGWLFGGKTRCSAPTATVDGCLKGGVQ